MAQQSDIPIVKDSGFFLRKKEPVVPIDLDWRNKYYRTVLWKRLIAFVIDYFIMLTLITIPTMIFFSLDYEVSAIILVSQFIFFILVCPLMESSKWHGSFGKWVMKIQITDDTGRAIRFGRAVVRNVLRLMVWYFCLTIIGAIYQYYRFKTTKKLLHDEFTETIIGERLD